jgi:hypothetical protein
VPEDIPPPAWGPLHAMNPHRRRATELKMPQGAKKMPTVSRNPRRAGRRTWGREMRRHSDYRVRGREFQRPCREETHTEDNDPRCVKRHQGSQQSGLTQLNGQNLSAVLAGVSHSRNRPPGGRGSNSAT